MSHITDEDVEDEFGTFSITIDSPDVMDKLKHLCQLYRLDVEQIVEHWVAFCSTKKLMMKKITLDLLDQLERERLGKSTNKANITKGSTSTFSSSVVYNVDSLHELINSNGNVDMMDAYTTPNGKSVQKKRHHTPEMSSASKRLVNGAGRSPGISQSPLSQRSPSTTAHLTPSQRYTSRTNAGEVICSFGLTNDSAALLTNRDKRTADKLLCVKPFRDNTALKAPYKYMFQKTADKAFVLDDLIMDMGQRLKEAYRIEEYGHVALPVQETVTVVGRVCCDSNGKLNASSLLLEGDRDTSGGRQMVLDVSSVPQYSLFPGQIIAAEGTNSLGKRFIATKIHEGIYPPSPDNPELPNGGFNVVIAAGPFTTTDNILNEPLADLVSYLEKGTPPDLCIVLGPFVDAKHPLLEKGDIGIAYEELFSELLQPLITAATRSRMQLIVVPSARDLHHSFVYPQPPYNVTLAGTEALTSYVHFVSDPCTLDIDGVVIGLTSTDILFHLGAEEISSAQQHQSTDRISRLVQHVLTQQTYYPLYPPHPDVPLDLEHFDIYCRLPVAPHILVLPSDLRCFIKDVGPTVCVNPGRMAKGQVGGTFTRLNVSALRGTNDNHSIISSVQAEIIRI